MDPVALRESSQRWLETGLAAFSRGDDSNDFAVHHAGVALEHLLKAYLASLHPALVAEVTDWDSLLHATGHGERARVPNTRTKTIGLKVAFDRVKKLIPKITVSDAEFKPVLDARNGVAHAGYYDGDQVRAVLTTCARLTNAVLAELNVPEDEYWGEYGELRDHLVDKHATELRLAVTAKLAGARETYRLRVQGLLAQQRIGVVAALSATNPHPYAVGGEVQKDCPACEGKGWLYGDADVDWHADVGENGETGPLVVLYPDGYDCAVCGLHLEGDEVELGGFDTQVALPEEDPGDFVAYDEDLYRDR